MRNTSEIWRYNNQEQYLYHAAKSRAKKYNIEFTITPEDIKIPKFCPYFNIPLTNIRNRNGKIPGTNPSLDRINNDLGYIPGNIQVISIRANRIKSNLSLEELETFAINILLKHSDVEVDYK